MENSEILYKKYSQKIYLLAFRMTGNKDDASDITQDTFIQAFHSMDKFKGESQIYTWLYQIAKNNCLKFLEKKKRPTFLSLQELIEINSSPINEEISETEKLLYISQVKDGCLSGLLRCLSLQQRLVFILHVLLGLPLSKVAAVIDKSENAARILVHRSKQNIKEFLCANCSLYDSKNSCRCDNLVNFSLKQGWLQNNMNDKNAQIESEIKDFKNIVSLYRTLQNPVPEPEIKQLLNEKTDFLILNDKKVK